MQFGYATCLWTRDCALAEFPGCGIGFLAAGCGWLRECHGTSSGCARRSSRERTGSDREITDGERAGGAGSGRDYPGCARQSTHADAGCGEESAGERGEGKDNCWVGKQWFGERNQETPQARRLSARWCSAEDRGSRGRSERTRGADCAWHDPRRSHPSAPERGTVAGLNRRQTEAVGGTHAGRKTAGVGGTDPQLHGWCAFGVEGRRCAESEYAGAEGTVAVGRFGEALKKGLRCQVSGVRKISKAPGSETETFFRCPILHVMLLCIT
jgi:hypothetical protein